MNLMKKVFYIHIYQCENTRTITDISDFSTITADKININDFETG